MTGRSVLSRKTVPGGVPGRVFRFTAKDGNSGVVLDLLDGQRLYQVIISAGPGATATHAKEFLNSFRISK